MKKIIQRSIYDNKTQNIFYSVAQAELKTGVKSIRKCLGGKQKTAGGFIWEYYTKNAQYINKTTKSRIPIVQRGADGKSIQEYSSIQEATRETNISASNICRVLKGKKLTAGGFYWEYSLLGS